MWSYSGDPASSDKDAVRFLIGDTDVDESFVTDEEINWAIANNSNVYAAAAEVAENLAAKFATNAEQIKVGPLFETYQNRSARYADVAKRLTIKAAKKSSLAPCLTGATTAPSLSIGITDFDYTDDTIEE